MHLHLETDIAAPADLVWEALGTNFARIDVWSRVVKASRAIDRSEVPPSMTVSPSAPVPGRETTTKVTLIEVLTDYDHENRSLTFLGVGLPPIIRQGRNVQTVRAVGPDKSTVVFDVDLDFKGPFEVLGPLMRKRMAKTFGVVQADLKAHVETANLRAN